MVGGASEGRAGGRHGWETTRGRRLRLRPQDQGAAANANTSGKLGKGLSLDFGLDWTATGPFRAGPVEIAGKASGDGKIGGVLSGPRAELNADFDSIDLPRLPLTKAPRRRSDLRGWETRLHHALATVVPRVSGDTVDEAPTP